jgi:3-deoxy-D-manno-octulosonic-acid transferase
MVAYSLALAVGLVLSAPWWVVRMMTTEKYREGIRERLGMGAERLRNFVTGKRVVWVHAVSVGEVLAGSRLVADLGEALGPEWRVVVSTTTRTGQALARERFGAERVFYLPLDFAFAVRAWMRVLQPEVFVLMESEVWPRLLHECKRKGVPVVVANARVSDRSFARAMKVRSFWGRVLKRVTLWLAQSEEDARRLREMGAGEVRAIGNLKFDVRAPKESRVAELIREVAAGRPIVVAGSTVGGSHSAEWSEEDLILRALKPGPFLVLAPRHPERFDEVRNKLAADYECNPLLASRFKDVPTAQEREPSQQLGFGTGERVLLLDTIGDLAAVYAVADVAFVGGSLVKRGGHNPLEPAQFGVPVVMGPSYENFRGIVERLRQADAICLVQDENELGDRLQELMIHPEAAKAMGERGRQVFEAQQGATARAVESIVGLVKR